MQQVLPFQVVRAKTDRVTKPLRVSQMESDASPRRVSRRAQFGRERPPCFGALVRPKPSRLRLGSLPPKPRSVVVYRINLVVEDHVDDDVRDTFVDEDDDADDGSELLDEQVSNVLRSVERETSRANASAHALSTGPNRPMREYNALSAKLEPM